MIIYARADEIIGIPEAMKWLKELNVVRVNLGLDSGDNKMLKTFAHTVDASEVLVIECGFVPNVIEILNLTNGVSLKWNDKIPVEVSDGGEQYAIVGADGALDATGDDLAYVSNTDGALVLIDGSNKRPLSGETALRSFGFTLAAGAVHINDADDEVLVITASRTDI